MFKKPVVLHNRISFKSSVCKKFKDFILYTFPLLNDSDINLLFPTKCKIYQDKLSQPNKVIIYWNDFYTKDKPLFIDTQLYSNPINNNNNNNHKSKNNNNNNNTNNNKTIVNHNNNNGYDEFGLSCNIYPTVYTMWLVPNILYSLIIAAPVSKYIISNGADLMAPGIILPKLSLNTNNSHQQSNSDNNSDHDNELDYLNHLSKWDTNEKRLLLIRNNPDAFAVGEMCCNSNAAITSGMKGKAMKIIHYYGDELYLAADRAVPNPGFLCNQIVPIINNQSVNPSDNNQLDENSIRNNNTDMDNTNTNNSGEAVHDLDNKSMNENTIDEKVANLSIDDSILNQSLHNSLGNEDISATTNNNDVKNSNPGKDTDNCDEKHDTNLDDHSDEESNNAETNESNSINKEIMDEALDKCLLYALKTRINESDFPMNGSVLLSSHMESCNINEFKLDFKRSTYKKMTKFLKAQTKKGTIKTKLINNELHIISFNANNAAIKSLIIDKEYLNGIKQKAKLKAKQTQENTNNSINEAENNNNTIGAAKRDKNDIVILLAYKPQQNLKKYVFDCVSNNETNNTHNHSYNVLSNGLYTMKDAKQILWDYVKINNLDNKQNVKLDLNLYQALFYNDNNKSIDSLISKSELSKQFDNNMVLYYSIILDGNINDESNIKYNRGPVPTINITIEQRSGNKQVSYVRGLEIFGISPTLFAKEAAKLYSASATLQDINNNSNAKQVLIQGNITGDIQNKLLEYYKIPPQYVNVQSNTTKTKGKK